MRFSFSLLPLFFASSCTMPLISYASTDSILVISDSLHVANFSVFPNIEIIKLDQPEHIKANLFADLPPNSTQSTLLAHRRLHAGGTELQQQLSNAYQGVVDAWALGIIKVPAVVVDRRYVVYGEPDVAKALASVNAYKKRLP